MSYFHMAALAVIAVFLGASQLVLKKAVLTSQAGAKTFWYIPLHMLVNGYFWLAFCLYGLLGLAWIWIITKVPISKAYPFLVISFLVVGVLERQAFGVSIGGRFVVGAGLILGGLLLIGR